MSQTSAQREQLAVHLSEQLQQRARFRCETERSLAEDIAKKAALLRAERYASEIARAEKVLAEVIGVLLDPSTDERHLLPVMTLTDDEVYDEEVRHGEVFSLADEADAANHVARFFQSAGLRHVIRPVRLDASTSWTNGVYVLYVYRPSQP